MERTWRNECNSLLLEMNALNGVDSIEERRFQGLQRICNSLGAEFAFWSWGQGHPALGSALPLGLVSYGLDQDVGNRFLTLGMTQDVVDWFRKPFLPLLEKMSQVCRERKAFWDNETWEKSALCTQMVEEFRLRDWMMCVRYHNAVSWSGLCMFRAPESPDFTEEDAALLEIAFSAIPWLHEAGKDASQDNQVHSLSTRNTQVLYLLLEGRSRKEIAKLLDTTTHIVNDSVKQIYTHFGTTSATELAAKFLRRV